MNRNDVIVPKDCFVVFPINSNGGESTWGIQAETFKEKQDKGYIKYGKYVKGSNFRACFDKDDQELINFEIQEGDL